MDDDNIVWFEWIYGRQSVTWRIDSWYTEKTETTASRTDGRQPRESSE